MEFELNEYHRNITNEELLADIERVAKSLNKNPLTQRDYKGHGKYGLNTIRRHFGSWNKAIELCGMQPNVLQLGAALAGHEHHTADTHELLDDIRRVARLLNKEFISSGEYKTYGSFSIATCYNRFSTWKEALRQAGLTPHVVSGKRIDDESLLKEIGRIWIDLGRQPTVSDMKSGISNYSLNAYARHFGGWRGALEAFIQYIEKENVDEMVDELKKDEQKAKQKKVEIVELKKDIDLYKKPEKFRHKTPRNVNYKLRFKVMQRDNFKCCICGNPQGIPPGNVLQVDHIIAWVKGGETVFENLQTLCSMCNYGKGDSDM